MSSSSGNINQTQDLGEIGLLAHGIHGHCWVSEYDAWHSGL